MANSDEYVKITLSNAGVITKDPITGADIIDKGQLANLERHFKMLERAIMSATNNTAFFSESMKKINEATGQAFKSFYIKKSDYDNVEQALKKADEQIWGKGKNSRTYLADMDKEDVQLLTFKRKRAGRIAQSLAEEAVKEELSGKAYFSSAKDRKNERMSFTIPVTDAEINALGGIEEAKKHYSKKLDEELKLSTKYSRLESKDRKEAEEEKQRREEETQKKKEEREATASRRKTLHWITAIVATVTAIANICRRILSATLQNASETKKMAVDSTRYGVTLTQARQYKYAETGAGLEEGTFINALTTLQNAFGNIKNLDEKALSELAVVMGGEIKDAIQQGLGASDPQGLMSKILNAYFNNAQQGKNSLGIYVGKTQAERELVSALEKAGMGELAKVLNNMFYTNNYGLYQGQLNTPNAFGSYMSIFANPSMHSPIEQVRIAELGQVVDSLSADMKRFKDDILGDFMLSMSGLVRWAKDLDLGKTEGTKIDENIKARQGLTKEKEKLEQDIATREEQIDKGLKALGLDPNKVKATIKNPTANMKFAEEIFATLTSSKEGLALLVAMSAQNIDQELLAEVKGELDKKEGKLIYHEEDYTQAGKEARRKKSQEAWEKYGRPRGQEAGNYSQRLGSGWSLAQAFAFYEQNTKHEGDLISAFDYIAETGYASTFANPNLILDEIMASYEAQYGKLDPNAMIKLIDGGGESLVAVNYLIDKMVKKGKLRTTENKREAISNKGVVLPNKVLGYTDSDKYEKDVREELQALYESGDLTYEDIKEALYQLGFESTILESMLGGQKGKEKIAVGKEIMSSLRAQQRVKDLFYSTVYPSNASSIDPNSKVSAVWDVANLRVVFTVDTVDKKGNKLGTKTFEAKTQEDLSALEPLTFDLTNAMGM